jgi:hypothetical protein
VSLVRLSPANGLRAEGKREKMAGGHPCARAGVQARVVTGLTEPEAGKDVGLRLGGARATAEPRLALPRLSLPCPWVSGVKTAWRELGTVRPCCRHRISCGRGGRKRRPDDPRAHHPDSRGGVAALKSLESRPLKGSLWIVEPEGATDAIPP